MAKVYIPCTLEVQLAPDEEHPNGSIVTLKGPGYVELTPELAANPVMKHLAPQSPAEAARTEKLYKAEQDHTKAIADADAELAKTREEVAKAEAEDLAKESEEYAKNAEAAAQAGQVYTEPHPDPAQQVAISITSPTGPVTAGSMTQKADEPGGGPSRPKLDDTHPQGAHGRRASHE